MNSGGGGSISGLTATGPQLNAAANEFIKSTPTAGTTQTLDGATLITTGIAVVTVGNNNDGVRLSSSILRQLVVNSYPANSLLVYPNDANHQIDALGNGNPYSLAPLAQREFIITY